MLFTVSFIFEVIIQRNYTRVQSFIITYIKIESIYFFQVLIDLFFWDVIK